MTSLDVCARLICLCLLFLSSTRSLAWHPSSSSSTSLLLAFRASSRRQRIRNDLLLLRARGGSSSSNNEHIDEHDDNNSTLFLGPIVEAPEYWATGRPKQGLILMDVFCSYFGLYMASRAKEVYGVAIIPLLSEYMKGYFAQQEQPEDYRRHYLPMSIPMDDNDNNNNNIELWRERLPCPDIVAVHCESDSGLSDAERFAISIQAKCQNGLNDARRDKYLMNQVVGAFGLPVVQQRLCRTLNETLEYASELLESCSEQAYGTGTVITSDTGLLGRGTNIPEEHKARCIVKPTRGVASENVHLCHDVESVQKAFEEIQGSSVFGSWEKHQAVLVQEFAAGTEYAVDIVSKNGEHKVAALWRYDKRPCNGAPFCYFATELIDATRSEVGAMVCDYARQSLDALNVKWGISHTEVIVTAKGPRLVEVNCRQHNMDFAPLTMTCIGYNAFDMLLAAYFGAQPEHTYPPGTEGERLNWDSLPDLPSLRAYGAMVHLVNFAEGTLSNVNGQFLDEIHNMESVMELEVYPEFLSVGETITRTIDIRSDAGWVQCINDDADAFVRDYNRIVELMPRLFEVVSEKLGEEKPRNAADSAVR